MKNLKAYHSSRGWTKEVNCCFDMYKLWPHFTFCIVYKNVETGGSKELGTTLHNTPMPKELWGGERAGSLVPRPYPLKPWGARGVGTRLEKGSGFSRLSMRLIAVEVHGLRILLTYFRPFVTHNFDTKKCYTVRRFSSLVPNHLTRWILEGLVKLLRRMTSGRSWVDVGRRGTFGPRRDNCCQSRRSIRNKRSTTEQSVITFGFQEAAWHALKTSETCGL